MNAQSLGYTRHSQNTPRSAFDLPPRKNFDVLTAVKSRTHNENLAHHNDVNHCQNHIFSAATNVVAMAVTETRTYNWGII